MPFYAITASIRLFFSLMIASHTCRSLSEPHPREIPPRGRPTCPNKDKMMESLGEEKTRSLCVALFALKDVMSPVASAGVVQPDYSYITALSLSRRSWGFV